MKAVVMAGGSGSRLRPLTVNRPKPMVPMVNKPVMAHIRDLLKRHDITEVVVTLQYMADVVQDFFGDGREMGMDVHYSVEEIPLGTAGSVKNAQEHLDDTFLVISGDAVTDFDLRAIIEYHKAKEAMATLVLYRVPNPLEYGVIILDDEGHIRQFLEKPSWGEVISDTVNTGIYVLEPEVLEAFEKDVPFDFSKDLFPMLLERGDPLYGYVASGYWCDVGNIEEYMRASFDILEGRAHVEALGKEIGGGIWVEDEVEIAPDAQLFGPIFLGYGVKIKGGVVVHGPSVIRKFTVVDNRAYIDHSIIWRNSYIGEGAEVRGTIIGRQCNLKRRARVFEAVVSDVSIVGEGATIHPNVKIWPDKQIEAGATVKSSIIWGSQGRRVLFGRYGITGLVNIDLTPESAAKLGAAFGATLPRGVTVTVNRDINHSARMIKRGLISGLPSAGIHAADLRSMPIPVARYYTRIGGAVGGVHVRISPYDARVVDIKFFDEQGLDLSKSTERKIEKVFFREDFRRVYLDEVGTIAYAPQVIERYTEGFLQIINVEAMREAACYMVVDYASGPPAQVLPEILNALNCNVVALNARLDEGQMSILPEDLEQALDRLALICRVLHTDLGVRFDVGGEKVFLVDDRGDRVPEIIACAAMAVLALRAHQGGTIAVPANAPRIFEKIAEGYGGRVLRTRVDLRDLTLAAAREGVIMAGDGAGNYIFPQFQPVVDGLFATVKLAEFLAAQKTTLSGVVASLPAFFTAHHKVPCPWEAKGTVMRCLNERYLDRQSPQVDGVRVDLGHEWVLILPDPDRPIFHVYAESISQDRVEGLADEYTRIVEELRDKEVLSR